MTLALRGYQAALVDDAREALKRHRSVVMQLSTGGGKTGCATVMLQGVVARGKRGNFFVHRQELVEQTVRTFTEYGIPHGVIAAGYGPNPYEPIQVCSIDTVKSRLKRGRAIPRGALNVWDECHHIAASGWAQVMSYFSDSLNVGLTATPERLDGQGLEEHFASLVCGPPMAQLISEGWLSPYDLFVPDEPDFSGVHTVAGDFQRKAAADRMDRPVITGNAVDYYIRNTPDAPAICFAVNRQHGEHVAQQFRDAGIAAAQVDGDTERGVRREATADFRRGNLKVLVNVALFGEGYDVPQAVTLIDLNPSQSLSWCLQKWGRVLRPAKGKACAFIHDHAGNIKRHGRPDLARVWTLAGEDRTKREARPSSGGERLQRCPRCAHTAAPRLRCKCGYVFAVYGRQVETIEGELREIPRAQRQAMLARESAVAESVDDLILIGRRRGYADPVRWAQSYFRARYAEPAIGDPINE